MGYKTVTCDKTRKVALVITKVLEMQFYCTVLNAVNAK